MIDLEKRGFKTEEILKHENGSMVYYPEDKKDIRGYCVSVPNGKIRSYFDVSFEHALTIAERGK